MLRSMTSHMARSTNVQVRENALRDKAHRRGYTLVKSMRRDESAIDYGRFVLVPKDWAKPEPKGGGPQAKRAFLSGHGLTLDDMDAALRLPVEEMEKLPAVVQKRKR
jgi:hypothetical protein